MEKGIFMKECPNCRLSSKVVKKCLLCRMYCCSECTVNRICNDCYITTAKAKERIIYLEDKIKCQIK